MVATAWLDHEITKSPKPRAQVEYDVRLLNGKDEQSQVKGDFSIMSDDALQSKDAIETRVHIQSCVGANEIHVNHTS